jgi:ABC-type uncharacterized transport system involved in gliding motility auxiliary subunit
MAESSDHHTGFSFWRRWAIAGQVVVAVLASLAIVTMVNYLSSRHYNRFGVSEAARHGLSPLTRAMLAGLTNQVTITVFFDPEESALFPEVRGLLSEYSAVAERLKVEYVNYGRNPGRAEFLLSQYAIASATDTLMVVFDTEGRPPRVVREKELSDYDFSGALQGQPIKRVGFKGEQFFTSALLTLADPQPIQAYALAGHGEANIENESAPDGYSRFAGLLAEKNILLRPLELRTNGVPADCELLIIGGPRFPIPPDELQQIDRYLRSGGRALILLPSPARPGVRQSGLESVLENWGVEVVDGLVVDEAQSQAGDTRVLLTGQFGSHPVVSPLQGARLGLIMPSCIRPRATTSQQPEGAQVDPLAFTSESGMIVTPTSGTEAVVQTNGVLPVAVAVEQGTIAGVSPDRGAVRLVVVGEATFLSNQLIEFEANQDFGGLAVNWLVDREKWQHLGPRPIREYQINLTAPQLHGAAWVLLGVLPGSALALGLVIWMRRRR